MAAIKKLRTLGGGRVGFMCPGCKSIHQVGVEANHPDRQGPIWNWNYSFVSPTFTPSILCRYDGADVGTEDTPPAICHSFVTEGRIQFLSDCTHALAGQTVDLPEIKDEA